MDAKHRIIVIGRQFGSGGRELGQLLAKRLNLNYYDKELITESAARFGYDRQLLEKADEKKPSLLRAILNSCCNEAAAAAGSYTDRSLNRETLYQVQSDVIRQLASEGGCVFVGRTADYLLRDHPNLTSVFIHAPIEHRAGRIIKRSKKSLSAAEAEDLARRYDREREEYYRYFTGRKWGDASNYDLSLDGSRLGVEGMARIIEGFINLKDKADENPGK